MYFVTRTVPGPAHPAEVVPAEVDEHDVLGLLLRVALELLGEELVLGRRRPARPGAGDRVGGQAVALDLEEELRARPDDLERRGPDEEEIGARVDPAQGAVEPDPVDRPSRPVRPADRTTGAGRGPPGSPRRRRSRPWRSRPRGCTRRARGSSRSGPSDSGAIAASVGGAARTWSRPAGDRGPGQLGRARTGRPLEGLEDRPLGDRVPTLEVGRVRVEAGDRADRVGEVVEDDHEVGLDEGRGRDPDGIGVGQRDGRLEAG